MYRSEASGGTSQTYPALARVPGHLFGICVVGVPGKSGIGGGIIAVSPGKGGLGTFSPLLDGAGNSVRGQLAARHLSRTLGLSLFASKAPLTARSPRPAHGPASRAMPAEAPLDPAG
jgi:glutaminase